MAKVLTLSEHDEKSGRTSFYARLSYMSEKKKWHIVGWGSAGGDFDTFDEAADYLWEKYQEAQRG